MVNLLKQWVNLAVDYCDTEQDTEDRDDSAAGSCVAERGTRLIYGNGDRAS